MRPLVLQVKGGPRAAMQRTLEVHKTPEALKVRMLQRLPDLSKPAAVPCQAYVEQAAVNAILGSWQ